MRWRSAAQRRAEEFDAWVEGTPASPGVQPDARTAEMLELVGALRAGPEVTARPEFVASLRERLVAEAATALVPEDVSRLTLPARRPVRERRLAAMVGGIAIVGATTSLAVASQSALPGDSLYPLKRAIEQAHTGLSVGEGSKGATVLANASDRLGEVEALTREDDLGNEDRIAETLTAFTDEATHASDLLLADYAHSDNTRSIARLRDFASRSIGRLAALEPLVPAQARDELLQASDVLVTIDAQAALRCPDCGGAGIDSIPPVLAAGETVLVPEHPIGATDAADQERPDRGGKRGGKHGHGTTIPDVDPDDIGPGSVSDPDDDPAAPGTGSSGGSNPIEDLTNGLTGGSPTGVPSIPVVTDVVQGVTGILEGVVGSLTDPLLPKSP